MSILLHLVDRSRHHEFLKYSARHSGYGGANAADQFSIRRKPRTALRNSAFKAGSGSVGTGGDRVPPNADLSRAPHVAASSWGGARGVGSREARQQDDERPGTEPDLVNEQHLRDLQSQVRNAR